MKIDISQKGTYHIFRIEEDLNIISDLSELRYLIQGYLHQRKCYIAVSFTNVSYIYSGAIAVLVDCYKQVKKDNGQLCIVEPHKEIISIFHFLKLDQIIPIYASVDDLLELQNNAE
jgi:anti-anti-sigma factor